MRDGERVTLWTRGAKASAAAIQRVLNRGDQALERTTALADLRTEVTAWSQESGFSAPAFVDYILRAATRLEISDLHIKGGVQEASVSVRRNGRLFPVGGIPRAEGRRVVARLKVLAGVQSHRSDVVQEGRIDLLGTGADVRMSFVPAVDGESVTARLFDQLKTRATLDTLGFDPAVQATLRQLASARRGLVLFAGASAAGKTTTLYTVLRHLMTASREHLRVITVEDPVECRIEGVTQLEVDHSTGNDYPTLLRSVLRQDANVLVVGEIRDAATAALAVEASLTGHLVLSTVHAGCMAECLMRLLDLDVAPRMLSAGLTGVVAQRLEKRDDGDARQALGEAVVVTDHLRERLLSEPDLSTLSGSLNGWATLPPDRLGHRPGRPTQ